MSLSPCQPGDRCRLTNPFQELQQEGAQAPGGCRDESQLWGGMSPAPTSQGQLGQAHGARAGRGRGDRAQRTSAETELGAARAEASPLQARTLQAPPECEATGKPDGREQKLDPRPTEQDGPRRPESGIPRAERAAGPVNGPDYPRAACPWPVAGAGGAQVSGAWDPGGSTGHQREGPGGDVPSRAPPQGPSGTGEGLGSIARNSRGLRTLPLTVTTGILGATRGGSRVHVGGVALWGSHPSCLVPEHGRSLGSSGNGEAPSKGPPPGAWKPQERGPATSLLQPVTSLCPGGGP